KTVPKHIKKCDENTPARYCLPDSSPFFVLIPRLRHGLLSLRSVLASRQSYLQPTTNNQTPTTGNQQPTTNNRQPITDNRQPNTINLSFFIDILFLNKATEQENSELSKNQYLAKA
ncbi:MAG: hypothetical protein MR820_10870, partial [Prevotella sp.]|nr:hypothetical protein [Prevotella sp.]